MPGHRARELVLMLGETVIALVAGFAIGAVLMAVYGYDPLRAYAALVEYSVNLADPYYLATTLSFATPLMLTGATFAVGVRAGVFNIGAEGALYVGALGAVIAAGLGLTGPLYLAAALLLGVGLGLVWNGVAGLLKAYRGVNEVVSTIMLNWIAFWLVEYVRVNIFPNPVDASKTVAAPPSGRLPLLVPNTALSIGYLVSLAALGAAYYLLWHTVYGYEIRATGYNPKAARYAGISTAKAVVASFVIGGALSGLAGVLEVAGRPPNYAITTGLSNLYGYGFDGITVSLIGANHPAGIVFSSILVGALYAGARGMQIEAGVPMELVRAVQGIIIMAMAVPGFLRLLMARWERKRLAEKAIAPAQGGGEAGALGK